MWTAENWKEYELLDASDGERLDLLNLGLSPASIVIMGSNKPFDEWQVHSGELLAVINVKDFD